MDRLAAIQTWYDEYVGSPEKMRALADGTAEMPDWIGEDVVTDNLDEIPGHFEGYEGTRRWARESFEIMDDGFLELQELTQVGSEAVVAVALVRGRMKETGIDPRFPLSIVHGFRGEKAVYAKGFSNRDAAFEFARGWGSEDA